MISHFALNSPCLPLSRVRLQLRAQVESLTTRTGSSTTYSAYAEPYRVVRTVNSAIGASQRATVALLYDGPPAALRHR